MVVAGVRCAGKGRKTWYECVKEDVSLECLVCMLNEQCSGICGGASFREERLTLAEHGEMDVLKIKDDDDSAALLIPRILKYDHISPAI